MLSSVNKSGVRGFIFGRDFTTSTLMGVVSDVKKKAFI
jgi:hypothetical protein